MPRCVAFLRAINVGGRTVKMDYLRSLFEDLGFADVETFIASGNVVFESKVKGVERRLRRRSKPASTVRLATKSQHFSEPMLRSPERVDVFECRAGTDAQGEGNLARRGHHRQTRREVPSREGFGLAAAEAIRSARLE